MPLPFRRYTVSRVGRTEHIFGGCCLPPWSCRTLFPGLHPVTLGKSPILQMGWLATFRHTGEGSGGARNSKHSEFICLFWGEFDNRRTDEARQFVPSVLLPARNRCLDPASARLAGPGCGY